MRVDAVVGLQSGGDEDDHRLADAARDPEHDRGDDPRDRGREDDPGRDLALGRPEPVGTLAQAARHRAHRVLGDRGDRRHDHDPHHQAGGEGVEDRHVEAEEVLEDRRGDEGEREVAEDDGRHADQDLEERLDDPAHPRGRVLGEVDRRAEPDRDRDQDRDPGDQEGAVEQLPDPERRPARTAAPSRRTGRSRVPTSWKNGSDSSTRAKTIPSVVRTEISRGEEEQRADQLLAPATASDAEGL